MWRGPFFIVCLFLFIEPLSAGLGRGVPASQIFAHMCLLDMAPESKGYSNICSGVLIDGEHILTAAHCFDHGLPKEITCGPNKTQVNFHDERVWIHPDYDKNEIINNVSYLTNDLALIPLNQKLASPKIQRLSLEKAKQSDGCAFFGFSKLNLIQRQMVRPDHQGWGFSLEALQWMPGTKKTPLIQVQGLVGKGSLLEVGDSGGPLMCRDQEEWKLVGIASSRDFHYNSIFAWAYDPALPWPKSKSQNEQPQLSQSIEWRWRLEKLNEERAKRVRDQKRVMRNLGFDLFANLEPLLSDAQDLVNTTPQQAFLAAQKNLQLWQQQAQQQLIDLAGNSLLRLKTFSLFYETPNLDKNSGSIGDLSFNYLQVIEQREDWLKVDLKVHGPSDTFLCHGNLLCQTQVLRGVWVKMEDLEIFVHPSHMSFERFALSQTM